jgi:hypothetical protein
MWFYALCTVMQCIYYYMVSAILCIEIKPPTVVVINTWYMCHA